MREYEIWLSNVNRWHSNTNPYLRMSNDTTQAHQCRVAQLVYLLDPDAGKDLLLAALFHDNAEDVVGDVPRGVKCTEHSYHENEVMRERGLIWPLKDSESALLKLCDSLDAYLWASLHDMAETFKPEWQAHREEILSRAEMLGLREKVWELLEK